MVDPLVTHVTSPINTQRAARRGHSCSWFPPADYLPCCRPGKDVTSSLTLTLTLTHSAVSVVRGSSPHSLNARSALQPAAVEGSGVRGAAGPVQGPDSQRTSDFLFLFFFFFSSSFRGTITNPRSNSYEDHSGCVLWRAQR